MSDRNRLDQLRKKKRLQELRNKSGIQSSPQSVEQEDISFNPGPSLLDVAGEATIPEFVSGRKQFLRNLTNPTKLLESAGNIGNELSNFPPINTEGGILSDQNIDPNARGEDFLNLVEAITPISGMTNLVRKSLLGPVKTAADVTKQQTLKNAQDLGFRVPRSNIEQTTGSNLIERFGGKQAVEATAKIANQPGANKAVAKALGLADDVPITPEVLQGLRKEAGKNYDVVQNIGVLTADKAYLKSLREISEKFSGASKDFPKLASQQVRKLAVGLKKKEISSEGAVEMIKSLREQASANFGPLAGASDKLLAKAQKKAANALEGLIERNIAPDELGKEILTKFRNAREQFAKIDSVEKAFNPSTGNVEIAKLTKQLEKGRPLTNELKQVAKFGQAFPKLAKEPTGAPPSGGLFEPLVFGTTGAITSGSPKGAIAALIPLLGKPLARKIATTIPKGEKIPREILTKLLVQRGILGGGASLNQRDLARTINNGR